MKRAQITVARHPTLTDVYQVACSFGRVGRTDVRGAAAAAALAAQKSLSAPPGGWHIFAPAEVLQFIPQDMRGKNG